MLRPPLLTAAAAPSATTPTLAPVPSCCSRTSGAPLTPHPSAQSPLYALQLHLSAARLLLLYSCIHLLTSCSAFAQYCQGGPGGCCLSKSVYHSTVPLASSGRPASAVLRIGFWYRQASGDMRLLNPVALVENHPACRKNDRGYAVLPNQLAWKPHLVLLLLSSKLLSDTDALLKIQQDSSAGDAQRRAMRMLLAGRKMPPIPYLINSFIQKKSVSPPAPMPGLCAPAWCQAQAVPQDSDTLLLLASHSPCDAADTINMHSLFYCLIAATISGCLFTQWLLELPGSVRAGVSIILHSC